MVIITTLGYIFRPGNRLNTMPLLGRIVEQAIREIPISNYRANYATCFCRLRCGYSSLLMTCKCIDRCLRFTPGVDLPKRRISPVCPIWRPIFPRIFPLLKCTWQKMIWMELDLFYRLFVVPVAPVSRWDLNGRLGQTCWQLCRALRKEEFQDDNISQLIKAHRLVICGPICRSRSTTTRPWTCVECNAVTNQSAWWTKRLYIIQACHKLHLMTLTTARCALRNVLATPRVLLF